MTGEAYFAVDPLPPPGDFVLGGPEGRHAATVRRVRPGENVVLTDGSGGVATATVRAVGRAEVLLDVGSPRAVRAPDLRVTLVQALPKGERGELAVELATEAGVDEIVPWAAERCVARWSPDRAAHGVARWRQAALQAAKQSRRAYVPPVRPLASTAHVVGLIAGATATLVLHESARAGLVEIAPPQVGELLLVVGPEGGLSDRELADFGAAGASAVRLGPAVLRTSTAAAVALGALGVLTGRWATPPAVPSREGAGPVVGAGGAAS